MCTAVAPSPMAFIAPCLINRRGRPMFFALFLQVSLPAGTYTDIRVCHYMCSWIYTYNEVRGRKKQKKNRRKEREKDGGKPGRCNWAPSYIQRFAGSRVVKYVNCGEPKTLPHSTEERSQLLPGLDEVQARTEESGGGDSRRGHKTHKDPQTYLKLK